MEVLDWGGSGRPILFVGCYLTGHVDDDIAPKLTDQFPVYAVTRRGVGASDRPATGYDPQRRADDILEVIRAVGMQKPILIGNSHRWLDRDELLLVRRQITPGRARLAGERIESQHQAASQEARGGS